MPKCEKFVKAYEACAERIKGDETGEAHCTVRCDAMRARTRGRGGCVRGDSSARGVTTDAGTTMITIRRRRDNTLTCTRAWTSAPRRKSWREPRDAARAYNITYSLTHSPTSTAVVSSFSSLHARSDTRLFIDKYCSLGYARLSTLDSSTTRTRSFLSLFPLHPKTPNFLAHAPPIRFDRGGAGGGGGGGAASADPSVSNTSMYLAYNGLVIDSATRHAQNTTRHARARFVPRWCRASRACADAVDAFASLACARASEWLRSCAPLGVDPRSGALGRASAYSRSSS